MDIKDIYKQEYEAYISDVNPKATKYEWAAEVVFDIYTDDTDFTVGLIQNIFQICKVISGRIDRDVYLDMDEAHYNCYMLMCQFLKHKYWITWGYAVRNCWFTDCATDCPDHIIDNEIYPDDGGVIEVRVPFSEKNLMALIDFVEEESDEESIISDLSSYDDR